MNGFRFQYYIGCYTCCLVNSEIIFVYTVFYSINNIVVDFMLVWLDFVVVIVWFRPSCISCILYF